MLSLQESTAVILRVSPTVLVVFLYVMCSACLNHYCFLILCFFSFTLQNVLVNAYTWTYVIFAPVALKMFCLLHLKLEIYAYTILYFEGMPVK